MLRKTNYKKIVRENAQYQLSYNPLKVLLETEQVFKSHESTVQEKEIEKIISEELEEDFLIGGHSDYEYLLENINTEEDFYKDQNRIKDTKIASLFIDLRNFTKRALFINEEKGESIEEIANLKQDAISTWMKLARYYQGHIHSITGDGLMILFGGTQAYDEDEWSIGARAFLLAQRILESTDILNENLKKLLLSKKIDTTHHDNLLDIKVGIEYSPNTLINVQGLIVNGKAIGEVKATSFEIDFSAKLLSRYQQAKGKLDASPKYGRILMLGEKYQNLMQFKEEIDIPKVDDYSRTMFGVTISRGFYFLDCNDYKSTCLTLEDVASLCDIYIESDEMKKASIDTVNDRQDSIKHG
ncbi:hypothetical protein ABC345_20680 [Shouchella sp. 1P09AA]|uniref:hypothetical protein n=1 Tax=unclassified Shouchella TaxID=2893065 RepID=UPI0039A18823